MGTRGYRFKTSHSLAGPGDGGKTGSWRVQRPVLNAEQCTPARRGSESCFICWLYCPDAVISRTIPPAMDYEYCKGCGICAEECPTKAITMIDEADWHVDEDEAQACAEQGPRPCS